MTAPGNGDGQRAANSDVVAALAHSWPFAGKPVKVAVLDVFPPDVPTGLAAVASGAEAGNKASIDLSWQPNTEADLAGYAVYRREALGAWQRISKELIQGPAYRDLDVEPGHRYSYAVTVLDQGGHESARSVEAEETAPTP